jgi:hypothetical protein
LAATVRNEATPFSLRVTALSKLASASAKLKAADGS